MAGGRNDLLGGDGLITDGAVGAFGQAVLGAGGLVAGEGNDDLDRCVAEILDIIDYEIKK